MNLHRRTTIVAGAALLAGLVFSFATPAAGQWARTLRSVLVRNVDEKGRTPYMQFQTVTCPGQGALICQMTFPPVPEGKRLVLEHVNASVNFALGGIQRIALLLPSDFIFVLPARPISDPNVVIVNETVLAYFESGQSPVFQVISKDGLDVPLVTTALSGYLITLEPDGGIDR